MPRVPLPSHGQPRLVLPLLASTLLASLSCAQGSGSERLPIEAGSAAAMSDLQPGAGVLVAPDGRTNGIISAGKRGYQPVTDDLPDFAPGRDVTDANGNIIRVEQVGDPYVLAFTGGEYKPAVGLGEEVRNLAAKDPQGKTYAYVMITGRLNRPDKIDALEGLGVQILGVHTWQCFVVELPLANAARVANLPFVRWVGHARPEQKLEPTLKTLMAAAQDGEQLAIDVSVFETDIGPDSRTLTIGERTEVDPTAIALPLSRVVPNGRMQKALEAAGFTFEHYTDVGTVHIFHGTATKARIVDLVGLDFVAAIEAHARPELSHDQSTAMVSSDRVRGSYGGTNVSAGTIDTGISTDPANGFIRHNDFSGKYFLGWSNVSGGAITAFRDGHSHGTHVAGTVFGEGNVDQRYMGNAPTAGETSTSYIRIGRYFDDAGNPQGNIADLYAAMASTQGTTTLPRAVNNSWGSAPPTGGWNGADAGSRTIDGYVYTYDQLHVFASGNTGNGFCHSPGAAKNVLTVGSVDDFWSGTTPGLLSSFSKYATADGRIKPEVVAPGQVVTSTQNKTATGYSNKSGTSMATPHLTGILTALSHQYPTYFDNRPQNQKTHAIMSAAVLGNPHSLSTSYGWGLVNAYKMHYGSTRWSWYTGWSGTLTASGQYSSWDVTVPSDAISMKVVLSWTEPAASSSATKARVNDLRLYLDFYPQATGGNTGEYSASSSALNTFTINITSIAASYKNQILRIKAYAQSIASGSGAKPAVSVIFYRQPYSGTPTFYAYTSPAIVQPGANFYLYSYFNSASNVPEFDSARIWPNGWPSGFTVTDLYRDPYDNTAQTFVGTSFPSSPYPSTSTSTSGGMTVGQGYYRFLRWNLKAPTTSNSYNLPCAGSADPLPSSATYTANICVDGQAPNTVAGLASTTHTVSAWSSNTAFSAKWTQGTDVGCADVGGYAYSMTTSSGTVPAAKNINGKATVTQGVTLSPSTSGWYFHIRSVDNANNFSGSTSRVGPFYIDTSNPSITSVQVNSNATYTNSLTVNVKASASDTYSGAYQMRYSGDNATWSGWYAYQTTDRSLNMASLGWTTSNGTKAVYVQVRDQALNVSPTVADTIVLDTIAPVISSATLDGGATVTNSLSATLATSVSGSPTEMRYSNNNSTWSAWVAYTSSLSVSLSAYGGNTNEGTKAVYVQCRDAAGNVSSTASDTILYYLTPAITGLSTSSITVVHDAAITVTGTGLGSATGFYWGSALITSQDADDWFKGWFQKVSATQVVVHPPQDQAPAAYGLRVRNGYYTSNTVNVTVSHNTTRQCGTPPQLQKGKVLDILVHRDGMPAATFDLLTFSVSGSSLVIPGLISLNHGGNAVTFIDPSFTIITIAVPHDPTKRTAHWAIPIPATISPVTAYFQTLMFDPLNFNKMPITVSTVDKTAIHN
ncbi:MAG: S8 family serine peptidase [Planctomycetota bacterium]